MEKDIAIGPETKASLIVADGKVTMKIDYSGVQAAGGAYASLDAEQFGKLLKDAIPGQIDDVIIDTIVAALKVV